VGSLPKVETDHDTGSDNAGLETGRKIYHLCISAVDGLTGSKAPGCLAAKLFHDRFQKPYRVVERASRFCLPMCAVTQKTHNVHFLAAKLSHRMAILRVVVKAWFAATQSRTVSFAPLTKSPIAA